ncbi:MAG TPA: hypothetical protein VGF36_15065, partial [Rhodopila sp.]
MAIDPGNTQQPPSGQADYGYRTGYPVQADIPVGGQPRRRRNGGLAAGILTAIGLVVGKLQWVLFAALKFKGLWFTVVSTGVTAL